MMPPRRKPCPETLSLLDYEPPRVSEGFDPGQVRAASLESLLALAVSTSLKEHDIGRAEVARRMTDYMGLEAGTITASTLNAYASQAKSDHVINAARLVALCAVLGDIRPLALLAEQLGYRCRQSARRTTVLAPKHTPVPAAPAWLEPVLDVYAHPIHRSVPEVLEIVAQRYPSLELPSVRSVQRAIANLGPLARNAGRLSAREMKRFKAFVKRTFDDLEPLDVISADGHSFKAEAINFLSGKPCKPEVVTVIDIATRKGIGFSVGLFEKAWLVADALRHAARHGVAAIFYTDNGCGFVNEHLGNEALGVLARLGTTHRTAIVITAARQPVMPIGAALKRAQRFQFLNRADDRQALAKGRAWPQQFA